jgi:hypothetical protein
MHSRTVLLALAVLIAFTPATVLANCEPSAGDGEPTVTPPATVHIGTPAPGGGVAGRGGSTGPIAGNGGQNPGAPAGSQGGTTNPPAANGGSTPTSNEGGVVSGSLPTAPTITGGTQEASNDPTVKITKGGTTTFTPSPDTSITGGVTRPEGGTAAVQGGTTRNIQGPFTNTGGTTSVKTNPDGTVTVTISGGVNKFTGGTNLDGSAVPVNAQGQVPAAVTVNPLPKDESVSVNYQTNLGR